MPCAPHRVDGGGPLGVFGSHMRPGSRRQAWASASRPQTSFTSCLPKFPPLQQPDEHSGRASRSPSEILSRYLSAPLATSPPSSLSAGGQASMCSLMTNPCTLRREREDQPRVLHRRGLAVVARDRAAHRDASERIHLQHHRVQQRTTHVLEATVDAARRRLTQGRVECPGLWKRL